MPPPGGASWPFRPRVFGRRRLHGPRQLGHRYRGGSLYNYALLSVILLANFTAIFLQALAAKLGIVTGAIWRRPATMPTSPAAIFLWLSAEVGIVACDIAEVIGSGIALNLLFHIPLIVGCALTALDVLVVLALQGKAFGRSRRWSSP